jgi:hypothetical protein
MKSVVTKLYWSQESHGELNLKFVGTPAAIKGLKRGVLDMLADADYSMTCRLAAQPKIARMPTIEDSRKRMIPGRKCSDGPIPARARKAAGG